MSQESTAGQSTAGQSGSQGGGSQTEAAREVLTTAGHEVSALASEAAEQARDLMEEARRQVREVTVQERDRFGKVLGEFTTELERMRSAGTGGYATQMADMVLARARAIQRTMSHTQPEDMVNGVQRYARTSPGMFLTGAVVLGFALGRVTRSAVSDRNGDHQEGASGGGPHYASPSLVSPPAVTVSDPFPGPASGGGSYGD